MLINEYNRAMDYRNSLRTSLHTTRWLSIGTIITLVAALFTHVIITFWIYLLIIAFLLFLVVLYFIIIQVKLNERLEKTDNYSNYIQILLRDVTLEAPADKKNEFIPFSFAIEYIRKNDKSLQDCLDQFNAANPNTYLKYKVPILREPRDWSILIQVSMLVLIAITIPVLFVIFVITTPQTDMLISIILAIIGAITSGVIGIIFSLINKKKKRKKKI